MADKYPQDFCLLPGHDSLSKNKFKLSQIKHKSTLTLKWQNWSTAWKAHQDLYFSTCQDIMYSCFQTCTQLYEGMYVRTRGGEMSSQWGHGWLCIDTETEHNWFKFYATFIVLVISRRCKIITTAASGQTHIKESLVRVSSLHSPADLHLLYPLIIYIDSNQKLLGPEQCWSLFCVIGMIRKSER